MKRFSLIPLLLFAVAFAFNKPQPTVIVNFTTPLKNITVALQWRDHHERLKHEKIHLSPQKGFVKKFKLMSAESLTITSFVDNASEKVIDDFSCQLKFDMAKNKANNSLEKQTALSYKTRASNKKQASKNKPNRGVVKQINEYSVIFTKIMMFGVARYGCIIKH